MREEVGKAPPRRGKTHLMVGLGRALLGRDAGYYNAARLVSRVQDTYGGGGEPGETIHASRERRNLGVFLMFLIKTRFQNQFAANTLPGSDAPLPKCPGLLMLAKYVGRLDDEGWWLFAVLLLPFMLDDAVVALAGLSALSFRRLGVPELEALSGAGVFYGAATTEVPTLQGREVYVVGGTNSAGQAAMHLSEYASRVTMPVRVGSLRAGMSAYLVRGDRGRGQRQGVHPRSGQRIFLPDEGIGETNVHSIEDYGHTGADKRVLVAGLVHQTNTFVAGCTGLEDFEVRRGEEMLRGDGWTAPVAGVLEVGRERGWAVLPALNASAASGATVADSVVDLFWAEFRAVADAAAEEGVDGVFLILHGSMVSESYDDVEGEVLRRIRSIEHLSDAPVCGVFGLHANFTDAMARQSDGLISYRENRREDARQAAKEAALMLDGLMQTEDRPSTVWDHPPVMWPPSGTASDSQPMLALEERAREIEAELPGVLAVNVLAGFPFADVPEAGVSFSAITTGDLELARGALRELNVVASSLREVGNPSSVALEEAMERLEDHREGPVLLVEPSDSVGAGAPGDGTRLLAALVERGIPGAGITVNDPETVAVLASTSPGGLRGVAIGGKSGEIGSEPLPLEVELVSRSDGRFVPEDGRNAPPHVPGRHVDMGPCAVVKHGDVTVLLTSRRTPPFDLGQWRSQGIDPEELFVIGVKAAVEHRPAYDVIARASYTIDLPGPCAENLERLPFERVSRPVYPLDDL